MSLADRSDLPDSSPTSPTSPPGRFVVVGNFDGVHRGHQALLRRASLAARKRALQLTVLTFHPHPVVVLRGEERPSLTPLPLKKRLLRMAAHDLDVIVVPFDRQLAQLGPEQFSQRILVEQLGAQVVLVGRNFRFGQGRAGDFARLVELGQKGGFQALSHDLEGDETGAYSSTRIRELLAQGDVEGAADILGRPYVLSGTVVRGDQRGQALGFPTANLDQLEQIVPRDGVYAVHVHDAEPGGTYLGVGVTNFGSRPTVERPPSYEVHLIDQDCDLYGRRLAVQMVKRLRSVQKFSSVSELKQQIALDVERARAVGRVGRIPEGVRWW